ncbi:MAG: chemotaxis protein CheA [Pseudomonadota bacterium]
MDNAILDAFFEECEDLLSALTEGLSDMREGQADGETVNAVFRAVHSIKGAAGAFSFEDLVGFAHKFETVLDALRGGTLSPDDGLYRVLQRAGDILANLVEAARDGTEVNRAQVDPVLDELQSFLGDAEPEEEFVFDAVGLDFGGPTDAVQYEVRFTPGAEFYRTGNDPQLLIEALKELGEATVTVDQTALPETLDDLDWGKGYLTWTVLVADQQSDLQILDVFQFVDDLCDLSVTEVVEDGDASPSLDAFLPPDLPATAEDAGDDAELEAPKAEVTQPTEQEPTAEPAATVAPPLAPADEAPAASNKPAKRSAGTLRVDPERVDRLINAVGELIINQSVISQRLAETGLSQATDLFSDLDDYKLLAREIQEGVMAIRAQPVKPLFQRMLRIGREAADATGKDVELITEGEATEVDKTVVERLADPLTHMVRNAIDHGIEAPDDREAAGKPRTGVLRLTANQRSGSIVIEIIDDGAGVNRPKVREIAVSKGLIAADAQLTDQEIDHLLFAPGFSTAKEVTNLSGRGVGMDVVKTAITSLGGRVAINSTPGQGTTFSITLPLTLAVMDGMIINVSDQTMVVPISSILETIRPTAADLSQIGLNNHLLRIRGEYVPIVDLATQLGSDEPVKPLTDRVLLLIQTETVAQCAVAVDDIFDQRQVVVKSMQGNYGQIAGISGATILGDGKIALIIDPDAIAGGASAVTANVVPPKSEGAQPHA